MNRYNLIPFAQTPPGEKRRYINIKYPKILFGPLDIYVYVTRGDRYDNLAQSYYEDSSLWWIISLANPSQDSSSLFPAVGSQIRIPDPSGLSSIIAQYENMNQIQ
jgi:hypothetical protein